MTDETGYLLPADICALAQRVIDENKRLGRTVTLAESCTGGLVASALTEIGGSSAVFECGFTTYSDRAKCEILNVSNELIETFGAVSMAVAWSMAQGALARSGANVAVAISGVAGPAGGTEKKPVGTVVFARAELGKNPEDIVADRRDFGSDLNRAEVRRHAVMCALELLLPAEEP